MAGEELSRQGLLESSFGDLAVRASDLVEAGLNSEDWQGGALSGRGSGRGVRDGRSRQG